MIHYTLLQQQAEEHVTAGKMALEYVGFLSYFAVYGALGFHFQVLKVLRSEKSMNVAGSPVDRADRRAGTLGWGRTGRCRDTNNKPAIKSRVCCIRK